MEGEESPGSVPSGYLKYSAVMSMDVQDERSLIWFSGKEEKQLRLNAVSKIIAGQRTSNFHRQPRPEKEYQSFSLIYGNGEQSLDLICKDKEQAEIWFVGLKALISGTQSHKLYVDSWSDGGLQSNSSSPAGHTRRKQPLPSVDDIEKFSHSGSNNCVRPLKVQSLYGSPPRQFTEKCFSARPLYSTESQKGFERHSLVNSLHSFPLDLRTDTSKVQIKENSSEGFRVSLSSVISSSSQGSVLEDGDVLGDVLMWGEGIEDGILGGGVHKSGFAVHTQVDALLPKAVQSTVMLDVHRVACGVRHAALVTRKGEIFCWGEENGGRLGHKVDVDVSQPKLVEALANNNIEFVACGEYHTCAISVAGELYIWGDGSHGDGLLGHGSSRSHWLPRRLSGPLDGIRVAKVSCGEWHTAVVASSGALFTFGDGSFGALGHGDTRSVLVPKQVESLKSLKTITVACGPWHTAAVVEVLPGNLSSNSSARKLFTWGDGDKGRLGHGDKEKKLVPTCVAALGNCSFIQVACGQTLTVTLTVSGQVYTMGSRAHGQLGNPQADGKAIVLVEGKLKGEFVEEISSGSFHVAVLTSKGEVYTWGKGANGRLGHGDLEDRSTPTVVEALKDRQVKTISCGSAFTAVICLHKSISGVDQSSCSECKMPFGFTRKRHNCYNCGFVFCHACSNKKATSACLAPNRSKPYRVCDPCYVKLNKVGDSGSSLNGSRSRRLSLMHQTMVSRETKTLKSPFFSPKVTSVEKIERFDGDTSSKKSKKQETLNLTSTSERWGQVSCPAFFHSNARVHPSPAPILQFQNTSLAPSPVSREQSPPRSKNVFPPTSTMYTPSTVLEELKQSNRTLTEEILRLQEQVKNLKQQCESKDAKFEQYECEIEEARALAREETTRCKAAKEVIRVLTGQLKDMAEKLPMKTQTSNMSTFLSPHLNALHELLSPTYTGHTEVPEKEDIKFYDHKFYLSPTTRVLKDIRVNGSCSPPVTRDTPTSALGRAFDYQNSARSTEGARRTGNKIKENIDKLCKSDNGHPPYTEWVEQDEPGVYFTFVSLADGQKDLKRVRFSRKRFSEREAEEWWAVNRLRIYEKYNVEGITGQL
ncbi:PH, RCC1 and FYVE domains-containing protein 1 isoform X2 [Cryptomeria japonica]|uniref:PH, RCC1 and FYVE domains-containing protein 1 isoform X2 n=1 Tax=Cryptomeria japonica TaxID=3369 RepID=UPI0025AB67AB|nr:PH, RCC1 and FYVE domains-containing protein 1 isoform X2 [Cryptomeria japonica]